MKYQYNNDIISFHNNNIITDYLLLSSNKYQTFHIIRDQGPSLSPRSQMSLHAYRYVKQGSYELFSRRPLPRSLGFPVGENERSCCGIIVGPVYFGPSVVS